MNTDERESEDEEALSALLRYLYRTRGSDFTGYKRTTLVRRLHKRMQTVGVENYAAYVDYLEVHPDEFPQLFNTLLINVTSFFRDPAAWDALAAELPRLLDARDPKSAVRVWSAGCASGEEAYTLAMVLAEHLGPEAFTRRVKIYATDLDEEALTHARQATYGPREVEGVLPALLEKYFVGNGASYTFNKELRRAVIFGRHDLVQDAPISRVEILSCRNTLMYFNAETQTHILNRLHFALTEDGMLFLGKAEMLLTHASLFTPLDLKLRLFARASRIRSGARAYAHEGRTTPQPSSSTDGSRLLRAAFDASPLAQMVVDAAGRLAHFNQRAAHLFNLRAQDRLQPLQDLEVSYRPAELRPSLDRAREERRAITLREVERVAPDGEKSYFNVELAPLFQEDGTLVGVQIAFADASQTKSLQAEVHRLNREIETAHQELQSTSEELETTNEELQSTVEELETTNEELQSTNEELETMNEELQSTNEELQTMNEELRQRGLELNQANGFLSAILASLYAGVVVLDQDLLVRAWNQQMERWWGLRPDEVFGKHVLNLDIALPLDILNAAVRECLQSRSEVSRFIEGTSRRGKPLRCKITATPLREVDTRDAVLLFEEDAGGARDVPEGAGTADRNESGTST